MARWDPSTILKKYDAGNHLHFEDFVVLYFRKSVETIKTLASLTPVRVWKDATHPSFY